MRPNALLTVAVITALWVVALIALLVFRGHLAEADRWWTWVCVAGIVLGLIAIGYFARSPFRR